MWTSRKFTYEEQTILKFFLLQQTSTPQSVIMALLSPSFYWVGSNNNQNCSNLVADIPKEYCTSKTS